MGVHSSSQQNPHSSFSFQDWQETPLSPYTNIKDPSYGSNFKVYTNRLNPHCEIQRYDLYFNSYQEYQSYRDATIWRNNTRYLVQAKHIRQPQKHQLCSTFQHSSVFIQRIPIRLVQIQDISVEEGLCIFYSALQGFDKIYDKYGFFQIQPQMIGFTKEGFVRVWLNKNLSRHYPENIYIENKFRTYEYFVQSLTAMVERLIDFQGRPTITEYLVDKHKEKPYDQIFSSLEGYAKEHQVVVPRYLSSIRNICQGSRKKRITTQRQQFKREKLTNLYFTNKNGKNRLELNKQVVRISVCQSHRPSYPPLEELKFSKKEVCVRPATDRFMSVSSRTPTVKFHYRTETLPNSPKTVFSDNPFHAAHNSTSTLPSIRKRSSNDSLYCFYKSKKPKSPMERWQIDPEIAADLAKLAPIME